MRPKHQLKSREQMNEGGRRPSICRASPLPQTTAEHSGTHRDAGRQLSGQPGNAACAIPRAALISLP